VSIRGGCGGEEEGIGEVVGSAEIEVELGGDKLREFKDGEGDAEVGTKDGGSLRGEVGTVWSRIVVMGKVEERRGEEKVPEVIGSADPEGASIAGQDDAGRSFAGNWVSSNSTCLEM